MTIPADAAYDLACETMYRFLAASLTEPRLEDVGFLFDPACQGLVRQAAGILQELALQDPIPLGFGELPAEELDAEAMVAALGRPAALEAEYTRVFGLVPCRECPPYETEYYPVEETFFRSQQMADIAGFYQAFGVEPTERSRERHDHLALELEFQALLLTKKRLAIPSFAQHSSPKEDAAVCQDARAKFFQDHLAWWVPSFSLALRRKAERGFYAQVGKLLAAFMPIERRHLHVSAPRRPLEASFIESPDQGDGCLVQLKT